MAIDKLPSDATFATAWRKMKSPFESTLYAFVHLIDCKDAGNSNPRVKLGVTGKGLVPYHKVIFSGDDGRDETFHAYDGRKPFKPADNLKAWSSAEMTLQEVRDLLAEKGVPLHGPA
jgi:hypothetical protein